MNIKSLNHTGLIIADLNRSRWFYGTVLGMQEVPRPETFKFAGVWFRSGNCEVHLLVAKDLVHPNGFGDIGIPDRPAFATHLAFEVEDFEKMTRTLEKYDVPIKIGPLARGGGMMQIFVKDPDGYLLEFFSWVAGSKVGAPERGRIDE